MSFLEKLMQAHRRRQTIRAIRALPPATLRDIGIEPDRIAQTASDLVAAQAARQDPKRVARAQSLAPRSSVHGAWPFRRSVPG